MVHAVALWLEKIYDTEDKKMQMTAIDQNMERGRTALDGQTNFSEAELNNLKALFEMLRSGKTE